MTLGPEGQLPWGVRLSDWQDRLDEFLAENIRRPYRLGAWDCIRFTTGAVDAMTGAHLDGMFDNVYSNLRTAEEFMGANGWGGLDDAMRDLFGPPLPDPYSAITGDLLVVPAGTKFKVRHDPFGVILMVYGRQAFTPANSRMGAFPLQRVMAVGPTAFKVG